MKFLRLRVRVRVSGEAQREHTASIPLRVRVRVSGEARAYRAWPSDRVSQRAGQAGAAPPVGVITR
eukprot:scaffold2377_cov74-Phaeocystis_antarctica.AAC.9